MPESTLRIYRDEFEDFLPVRGAGRRRRYGEGAEEILARIVAAKRAGHSSAEIRQEMKRQAVPQARARRHSESERWEEIAARIGMQSAELAALRAEIGALRREVGRLTAHLEADRPPSWEESLLGADPG